MATASRNVRKTRRIKRDRSLAYKMIAHLQSERDGWRGIAQKFATQLQALNAPVTGNPLAAESVAEAEPKQAKLFEMEIVPDETEKTEAQNGTESVPSQAD